MQEEFSQYCTYLGEIPEFLKKYLELDIFLRLLDISLLCGMDYMSKHIYSFKLFVSRYTHSLNTALITWKLTGDSTATLAALFHDVSSPAFSHVVDFMNGDTIKQESTEEKTKEILLSSKKLAEYLESDDVSLMDIINFKDYSVVDLSRPKMCADRLESTISVGMSWVGTLKFVDAKKILDDIYLEKNEDGEDEIAFRTKDIALYVSFINDEINKLTHSKSDYYMMMLMAKVLKLSIKNEIISYDDLFKLGEHEVMDLIEDNKYCDIELTEAWDTINTIKSVNENIDVIVKNKIINPLVKNRRLRDDMYE